MKKRCSGFFDPPTIEERYENFGIICKGHINRIDEDICEGPSIQLQVNISRMLTYLHENRKLVRKFIRKFETMDYFIKSFGLTLKSFHQELTLTLWMFSNDSMEALTNSEWKLNFLMEQRCTKMLEDIEEFEVKTFIEFKNINEETKNKKRQIVSKIFKKNNIPEEIIPEVDKYFAFSRI